MSTAHHSASNWLAPAVALLLCCNTAVNAQAPAKPKPEGPAPNAAAPANERFTLMTYDVGDLVITVRDYPYSASAQSIPGPGVGGGGGGFGGGGGGGQFSVPDEPRPRTRAQLQSITSPAPKMMLCQFGGGGGGKGGAGAPDDGNQPLSSGSTIAMNDLMRVLTGTIASNTWEQNGGEGKVEALGTTLVVWQTKPVHDLVRELLNQIRQTSGHRTTLTVDARWLMLTSDELDTVFNHDPANPPAVDRKALAAFTRRAGSIRGITNCFSGQLVFLISGTRRNVVSGYIPVVGAIENGNAAGSLVSLHSRPRFQLVADSSASLPVKESHVGYQPIVETPNFGALLEIRPTSMGGAKSDVIVELKSTLTAPSDLTIERPRGTAASDSMAPAVDRVSIETQELATTMRVPFGKPVLVGGMTYLPGSAKAADDVKSPERPQLYLVLEIR